MLERTEFKDFLFWSLHLEIKNSILPQTAVKLSRMGKDNHKNWSLDKELESLDSYHCYKRNSVSFIIVYLFNIIVIKTDARLKNERTIQTCCIRTIIANIDTNADFSYVFIRIHKHFILSIYGCIIVILGGS